jgi:molecular chaperone GrpE
MPEPVVEKTTATADGASSPGSCASATETPTAAAAPINGAEATQLTETDRVSALERERDEYKELALRVRADFENYQKRVSRDREQERKYAAGSLAADLLPALDNLDRFLENVKEENPLTKVVATVRNQLLEALKRHGVTTIPTSGQPFDPYLHMAIMQEPTSEHPPGTILSTFEAGYTHHDRVLRAAKVKVAAAPESTSPSS